MFIVDGKIEGTVLISEREIFRKHYDELRFTKLLSYT